MRHFRRRGDERHGDVAYRCAAASGLPAVRSTVAGVRERTVRSTRAAETVGELRSLQYTDEDCVTAVQSDTRHSS